MSKAINMGTITKVTRGIRQALRDGERMMKMAEDAQTGLAVWDWLLERTPEAQEARRVLLRNAPRALGRQLLGTFIRRGLSS